MPSLFKEFPTVIQNSLRFSLTEFLTQHLERMPSMLVEPDRSLLDNPFIASVLTGIIDSKFDGVKRWTKVDFELPAEDLKQLLRDLEYELRRKKPTTQEVAEFKQVLGVLGREEKLPLDYWLFKRRLYYLSHKAKLVKTGSKRG